ncbi:hypothetical protein [Mycobacteroides franklinii]|uniref:Uncharacterized protein n=1 Tax=Mycobacteroides franklinii TaxID=948102 RepID=A0A4R5P6W0_9MYCO|nr:hypothetical protein [Mycobacteroides franklinii]TDH19193.1 hypothetical protein EJ571_21770 [Mycobacteroides franklinii]
MTIDSGNLPVAVRFVGSLRPQEYERAIAVGYGNALLAQAQGLLEAGGEGSFKSLPSRRQKMLDFLAATTWDQYMEKAVAAFGGTFRAESHFRDRHGKPGVTLVADNTTIATLDVSPDWVAEVGAGVVAGEVVQCGSKIRSMRSSATVASSTDCDESDDQLEVRLLAHLTNLLLARES